MASQVNSPKRITEIMRTPRLMVVLAHPDDESLGVGGTLAKYASEGVDVFLLTATRGDSGRFRGFSMDDHQHPGPLALANIRESELRAAASALGVREVSILNYHDQHLDHANPREAIAAIVGQMRRVQPDVVVTFGPARARSSASCSSLFWRLPLPSFSIRPASCRPSRPASRMPSECTDTGAGSRPARL